MVCISVFGCFLGLKEDRRGWTMSRRHGYCMVAWSRMSASCLILSLSLIVIQGRGDVELAKDDRYEWKTGELDISPYNKQT